MEASAIELSPSVRDFADFAKIPVREYARRDAEETDTEMRDDLVDSPLIRVESMSQSSLSDRDSPILRSRLALSGVRDSKAVDEASRGSFPSTRLPIPCPSTTIMVESSPSYWVRPPT